MVAWLHSSAAARLPPAAAVESALRSGAPDAAVAPPHPAVLSAVGGRLLPSVAALLAAWGALKSRPLYRGLMEALEHALSHARTAHAAAEARPATATTAAAAAATATAAVAAAVAAAAAAAAGEAKEARRRGRVEAAAALLRAAQPLADAAATCGEFVDAAREQCALLDSPALPEAEQDAQPEEAEQDAHAHAERPEPLGVLAEAVGASGLPDSYEAFERAEHSSLRRAHEEICASELGTRVRDWRRAMCALHAALAPHTAHLDALRTQLRWCVVHLQRLAEQLRRADGELLGAATSGSVSGETYESAVYGRISNDGLMSTR